MNPVLLITVPLILGFISLLFKRLDKVVLLLASMFNVATLFFYELSSYDIGGFKAPYGISLLLDDYSLVSLFFLNVLFLLTIITNFEHIKNFAVVLLIALSGLNGLLLTHDLFNLFVFLEIAGIAAYIITTQNKKVLFSFQYLVIGSVGSGLYLLGLIILYAMVGTLNMSDIASKIGTEVTTEQVMLPILLMFIGLAIEAKLLPFSSWVKGVLEHSTQLVGVMIASIYAGTMLFVFGRLFTDVFSVSDHLYTIIVMIGLITLIGGEFAAFAGNKLREILLFSSVAQAGLIVILFVSDLAPLGVLMIISNILSKFILFSISGHIVKSDEFDDIDHLSGIFSKNKILGFSFSVAALSLAGLPLFYGFLVKINMLYNLFIGDMLWITGIILMTSVIEGAYFVRMLVKLWSAGDEGEYANNQAINTTIKKKFILNVVVFILAVVIIILGVLPHPEIVYNIKTNPESVYPVKIIIEWGGLL